MVSPQHVCVSVNSVGVISPLVFLNESSHVVANTKCFFLSQYDVLREEDNRLIAMTLELSVGVVFSLALVIDGTHFVPIEKLLYNGVAIVVDFTKVVEHSHDKRTLCSLPLETVLG